jgi:PASTA domain
MKAVAAICVLFLATPAVAESSRGETSATAPVAVTGIAQAGDWFAFLNGTVDPGGLETQAWFEWGPTPALGSSTPVSIVLPGNSALVTAEIFNLESFTTYYFRIVATNASGTGVGDTEPFSTLNTEAPPTCIVPRVVGKRLTTARMLIRRAGCRVGQVRRKQSRRRNGTVLSQAPRSGARAWNPVRVRLVVSSGRR